MTDLPPDESASSDVSTDLRGRPDQRSQVLLDINNAIVSHLDRQALLDAIGAALGRVLPLDRASLTLYDADTDALEVWALTGATPPGGAPVGRRWPRRGSSVGWVWEHHRALVTHDMADAQWVESHHLVALGLRSCLAVPLPARGQIVGTLNIASRHVGRYDDADAALLAAVAEQVGLAVANMLAYQEIARLQRRLEQENRYLRGEAGSDRTVDEVLGRSEAMRVVREAVATVGPTDASVLITGETGTGKELVAHAVHNSSPRRGKALVKLNCAALPAGLVESELFGHEKGAFTGATGRRIGRFELADAGTLFLDEIGDLPLDLQAKLLRVLQEGQFERVGGAQTLQVDVRVVTATNQLLPRAIEEGRFRADLFYRLNVFPIAIPPLRERREDVPVLVRHLILRHATRLGRVIESVSSADMDALQSYAWPGNVRELNNLIERAVILTQGRVLDLTRCLPLGEGRAPSLTWPIGGLETLEELERRHITAVLRQTNGRISGERGAARILGVRPSTLESRLRRLGITKPR